MAIGEDQAGVASLVRQLVDDVREVGTAEVALAIARLGGMVSRYKSVAVYFASAGVVALCGFIALLVGLILTLAPRIGAGFATLAVVGATMLVAAILGLAGRSALRAGSGT